MSQSSVCATVKPGIFPILSTQFPTPEKLDDPILFSYIHCLLCFNQTFTSPCQCIMFSTKSSMLYLLLNPKDIKFDLIAPFDTADHALLEMFSSFGIWDTLLITFLPL